MSDCILRVLLNQHKYETVKDSKFVNRFDELSTYQIIVGDKIAEGEKIGGCIEDNIFEVLGYVYDSKKYNDKNYIRKELNFDWYQAEKDSVQ